MWAKYKYLYSKKRSKGLWSLSQTKEPAYPTRGGLGLKTCGLMVTGAVCAPAESHTRAFD